MQKKKENLEIQILEKATDEFLKKGYNKASLRLIARECNITPGNLYNYFTGKEDLYINVTLNYNKERLDFLFSQIDNEDTTYNKLYKYAEGYYNYAIKNIEKFRLFMHYELNGLNEKNFSENTKNRLCDERGLYHTKFISIIKNGIEQGEISKEISPSNFIRFYTMSVRVALNETVLLKYGDKDFYFGYINFLLQNVKRKI